MTIISYINIKIAKYHYIITNSSSLFNIIYKGLPDLGHISHHKVSTSVAKSL